MKDIQMIILGIIAIVLLSLLFVYTTRSLTGQVWVEVDGEYVQKGLSENTLPWHSYRGTPQKINERYYYTYQKTPSSIFIMDREASSVPYSTNNAIQNQVIIGTTRPSWVRERPYE